MSNVPRAQESGLNDNEKNAQDHISRSGRETLDEASHPLGREEVHLGMTKEYSGWDVYNNEALKVDTELVKDWQTSLNSLLIFVRYLCSTIACNSMLRRRQFLQRC